MIDKEDQVNNENIYGIKTQNYEISEALEGSN